ncbi:hypothetical protein GW17_00028782 [Ensete ventricosum]|nr:hypothetical protein GW17_00028782 [Ensete ventricosum]
MGSGGKRKKAEGSDAEDDQEKSYADVDEQEKRDKKKKGTTLPSMIKNKEKRSAVHAKLKREKKIEKRRQAKAREASIKRALDLGEEACSFPFDLHLLLGFYPSVQLFAGNDADEFSQVLKQAVTPKILITTNRFNSTIVEYAKNKDFTSVVVVHSNRREPG